MNFLRIKKLMKIRNNYHPLISILFRRYPSKVVSIMVNSVVGICCLILLAFAFLGLDDFLSGYGNIEKIVSISGRIIFVFCFLATIRSAYSFLYSGSDIDFLKTLPTTQSEIITSNFIYFLKRQLPVSLFFILATLSALEKYEPSFFLILGIILLGFLIPLIAISLSFILCFIIHLIAQKTAHTNINQPLSFSKSSTLFSLVKFEIRNFKRFPSLKTEIIMQWFVSAVFTFSAINSDVRWLAAVAIYPALSMVNISSFSREGSFHDMLETLPIKTSDRFLAKTVFYFLIVLTILLVCFAITALKNENLEILLSLIPSICFLTNITIIGIKIDSRMPKIHWTNPQDAFRMNLPFLFGSILLGVLTEGATFIFGLYGTVFAIVANVCILSLTLKRKS